VASSSTISTASTSHAATCDHDFDLAHAASAAGLLVGEEGLSYGKDERRQFLTWPLLTRVEPCGFVGLSTGWGSD
jgi:hypothetical protein